MIISTKDSLLDTIAQTLHRFLFRVVKKFLTILKSLTLIIFFVNINLYGVKNVITNFNSHNPNL